MSEHFNKKVGKFIESKELDRLKHNWKKTKIETQSSFFGADIVMEQLKKPGAVGIRIFYGLSDDGVMQPVIFAADDQGRAIITTSGKDESDGGGANASAPCPPICPP